MARETAPRIAVDSRIRFGKPVIRGTRVPVDLVIAKLAGGMTPDEVADEYEITLDDVRAALSYAALVPDSSAARRAGRPERLPRPHHRRRGYPP